MPATAELWKPVIWRRQYAENVFWMRYTGCVKGTGRKPLKAHGRLKPRASAASFAEYLPSLAGMRFRTTAYQCRKSARTDE